MVTQAQSAHQVRPQTRRTKKRETPHISTKITKEVENWNWEKSYSANPLVLLKEKRKRVKVLKI